MDYYLEHYKVVYKTMVTGAYFGDYEVIMNKPRKDTTRAKIDSRLLALSKETYKNLIESDYKEVAAKMLAEAQEKKARNKSCLINVIFISTIFPL